MVLFNDECKNMETNNAKRQKKNECFNSHNENGHFLFNISKLQLLCWICDERKSKKILIMDETVKAND